MAEMKAAGIKWLALNIGDGQSWEDWRIVVDRSRALGVTVLPWKRCRTPGECRWLLEQAEGVGFHALLNIEDEFKDVLSPYALAPLIAEFAHHEHAVTSSISTVAWLYNDVDYSPLAQTPLLLQIFPADNDWDPAELEQRQADCIGHARDKRIQHVGITFQTYAGAKPEWYAYEKAPRSLYTGDDVGAGNWEAWT